MRPACFRDESQQTDQASFRFKTGSSLITGQAGIPILMGFPFDDA
jgi:hypothetical protein